MHRQRPEMKMSRHRHGKKTLWSFLDSEAISGSHGTDHSCSEESFYYHNDDETMCGHSGFIPMPASPSSMSSSPWSMSPNIAPPGTAAAGNSSPSSYRCITSMLRHDGHIYALAIGGEFLYTGAESRRVRVWKRPDFIELGCFKSGSGMVKALLAVGDSVFSAHQDHKIRIWQREKDRTFSCRRVATLPTLKDSLHHYFHPLDHHAKLGRDHTRKMRHTNVISSLAYNHQEGLLYSGSWDRSVKAWRVSDLKCIDSIAAHDDAVNAVLVARDGSVFTGSADSSIKVWRKVPGEATHTLTMTLKFQRSPVNALAFSEDEFFLYSGSSDGIVNYWEKEMGCGGRLHHTGFLRGHRLGVLCLACKERMVFSGSEDKTIRVWRREMGHVHSCLAVLEGHRGAVMCIGATIDNPILGGGGGCLVYSGSLDRTVKVWLLNVVTPSSTNLGEKVEELVEQTSSHNAPDYGVIPVLSPSWVQTKLNNIKSCSRS
eukprot:Gb_25706 [translate_table: standard]